MSWLAWIVIGALAGWLTHMAVHAGVGLVGNLVAGIIGAFIGGWLFTQFGMRGVTGFNFYSLGVAIVGAVALLFMVSLAFHRKTRAETMGS